MPDKSLTTGKSKAYPRHIQGISKAKLRIQGRPKANPRQIQGKSKAELAGFLKAELNRHAKDVYNAAPLVSYIPCQRGNPFETPASTSRKPDALRLSPTLNTYNKLQALRAGLIQLIDTTDLTRSRAAPPACRGKVSPPRQTEARAKRTLYLCG